MATKAQPKKQISRLRPVSKCLLCEKPATRRGLCTGHAAICFDRISKGETTEDEAIEAGLLLPSRQGKRPEPNAFDVKLAEFKALKTKKV